MAKGKSERTAVRPRAAMGTRTQRRKIVAGVEAVYDALAMQEGRPRDPTGVHQRLNELHSVISELLRRAVPAEIEQAIAAAQRTVARLALDARALMEEAKALFAAVDNADLPTIERYLREHPPSPGAIGFLVLVARDRYKSEIARNNAMERIKAREPAKEFILEEWERSHAHYRSKAEFSRHIHPLVRKKFPGLDITSRTIERDWLPTSPSPRKPPK